MPPLIPAEICKWTIQAASGQYIHIQILSLESIQSSPQCTDNYLEISQGNSQQIAASTGGDTKIEGNWNLAALGVDGEELVPLQQGAVARYFSTTN